MHGITYHGLLHSLAVPFSRAEIELKSTEDQAYHMKIKLKINYSSVQETPTVNRKYTLDKKVPLSIILRMLPMRIVNRNE